MNLQIKRLLVAGALGLYAAGVAVSAQQPPAASLAMLGFTASDAAAERALEQRFDARAQCRRPARLDEAAVLRAQPGRLAARQGQCRVHAAAVQGVGLGRAASRPSACSIRRRKHDRAAAGRAARSSRRALQRAAGRRRCHLGRAGALPPYNVYGADGDVSGELVYVNYGMPEDYRELARRGIDVKGKIVIARYGGGWRGLKPKLAHEHGAIGCIIYSDPRDDGYAQGDVYPAGRLAAGRGRAARLGRRHDALSRRSADARGGRDRATPSACRSREAPDADARSR